MQEPGSSWAVGVLRTLKKLINHKKNIMLKENMGLKEQAYLLEPNSA
jgi:hypothetical protein